MLGRGSFIESFPLFGYDLNRYEELFDEKLELFVKLLREERGSSRPGSASVARRSPSYAPHTSACR